MSWVGHNEYLVSLRLIPCSESEKNTNFKYNGHKIDYKDMFAWTYLGKCYCQHTSKRFKQIYPSFQSGQGRL